MSLPFDPQGQNEPPPPPGRKATRRQRLGDPANVRLVIALLVVGSVLPLLIVPISSFAGRVALLVAVAIGLFLAMSIKRESDRIARRDEERASPRCRLCGRRYDEPLEAVTSETVKRCAECGRPSVDSTPAAGGGEA